MTTKTYYDSYTDCEISVEEMTRKEALSYAKDFKDCIELCTYTTDMNIYIEYKDGSFYSNIDGDIAGVFKQKNIKGIILDDGFEYYIYGEYEMSDNTIPELI